MFNLTNPTLATFSAGKSPVPSGGAAKFPHCYTMALLVALHEVQQLLSFRLILSKNKKKKIKSHILCKAT